jgi:hypothetical protein
MLLSLFCVITYCYGLTFIYIYVHYLCMHNLNHRLLQGRGLQFSILQLPYIGFLKEEIDMKICHKWCEKEVISDKRCKELWKRDSEEAKKWYDFPKVLATAWFWKTVLEYITIGKLVCCTFIFFQEEVLAKGSLDYK